MFNGKNAWLSYSDSLKPTFKVHQIDKKNKIFSAEKNLLMLFKDLKSRLSTFLNLFYARQFKGSTKIQIIKKN